MIDFYNAPPTGPQPVAMHLTSAGPRQPVRATTDSGCSPTRRWVWRGESGRRRQGAAAKPLKKKVRPLASGAETRSTD